jgi:hypothetical protein
MVALLSLSQPACPQLECPPRPWSRDASLQPASAPHPTWLCFLWRFLTFVLTVDTSSDCHLSYEPLGCCTPMDILHYVQPRCPLTLYPSELASSVLLSCKASHVLGPALIKDELGDLLSGYLDQLMVSLPPHLPVCGVLPASQPTNADNLDLSTISLQITSLAKAVSILSPMPPLPLPADAPTSEPTLATPAKPPQLLSTLPCDAIIKLIHCEGTDLPSVCLCNTANALDTKTHLTLDELHQAMGCRKLWNYKHLLQVSRDGKWMDGEEFPAFLGSYTPVHTSNSGGPIDHRKYKNLDPVHMDIAFGDCLSVGSFQYALILVDCATLYNRAFSLINLLLDAILAAIRLFQAAAGSLVKCYYCDYDLKLFGTAISEYLIDNDSEVVAAPAKHQSSNSLFESHWKIMVHMRCAYLIEKQMPWTFWFYAIIHSAWMMNAIPGTYSGHLASPFLLVHGVGHNERTWIPLFILCYFHHEKDSDQQRSKHQAHTMDGIAIGRSPTSNALMVYSPRNQQYYKPDSYRIDPYQLPTLVYPDIKYDGSLFCYLLHDKNPHMEEKYPPGTRIEQIDPSTNMLLSGMVMDIPFLGMSADSPPHDLSYEVLFDNSSTASIPLQDMALLIPPPPVNPSSVGDSLSSQDSLHLLFLCINSKITYEHEGQYHKGYLTKLDSSYWFLFKLQVNKKKEDWGVD